MKELDTIVILTHILSKSIQWFLRHCLFHGIFVSFFFIFAVLETVNGGHIGRSLCKQTKIAIGKDHSDIKLVLFHHRFLTIFLGCLICLRPPETIIKGSLKFEKRKTKKPTEIKQ